eukprot:8208464-Pyramimonas_sp.AAC.1
MPLARPAEQECLGEARRRGPQGPLRRLPIRNGWPRTPAPPPTGRVPRRWAHPTPSGGASHGRRGCVHSLDEVEAPE